LVDADDEYALVLLLELIGGAVASALRAIVEFSLEGLPTYQGGFCGRTV